MSPNDLTAVVFRLGQQDRDERPRSPNPFMPGSSLAQSWEDGWKLSDRHFQQERVRLKESRAARHDQPEADRG